MADLTISEAIFKLTKLEAAIEDVLKHEVLDEAKKAIVDSAKRNVYDAYTPEFYSRRNGLGGILDPTEIQYDVNATELVAWQAADWQQLYGGQKPEISLAEAIASGSKRFYFQNAGPRPFHAQAEKYLIQSGKAREALRRGLMRKGYITDDGFFSLI